MKKNIYKLLKALEQRNIIYCIDRKQFYSTKNNRRCTKITLHREYKEDIPKEEREVNHYFWNDVEVVKFLADKYKEVST